ncbi:nickel pincer cofactor biosynthesis protein LarC [Halobacillus naozhouensis]|uniref:Nickel pincer cofactor biosynthesis protein LarC n=1 Tax=Halobacillus naozhouensis TaxID=554880 RepID=A0ABY8IXU4_9BACI|nr:nickel pincer cofactor biosynthesis protein LarC [Halobacillus naozhouensis]WFT74119.1 nickel pincer cofactor biosynthesis protein LarC [Halobacillus naozhouensis]
MKTLYFDCFSGISGDMTIGALVDAGVAPDIIELELRKLDIESEYRLEWTKVVKNDISATKFDVHLTEEQRTEDSHHHHRHHADIVHMIKSAGFEDKVRDTALSIFEKIGRAEAKIHDIPFEKVHFHEVGAIDSIVDIVGTAIALEQLGVNQIISSPIPTGSGKIHIDHGIYPVPAPATMEILKGIPLQQTEVKGELTTPTGAGIIAALVQSFGAVPSIKVDTVGYGAGTKDFQDHPNVLRVMIGETY